MIECFGLLVVIFSETFIRQQYPYCILHWIIELMLRLKKSWLHKKQVHGYMQCHISTCKNFNFCSDTLG